MWQRFTERSRRAVFFAQEEASLLGCANVSTEHLLLGMMRDETSVAVRILNRMGVTAGEVRAEIERLAERGDGSFAREMQLTPHAKKVIDLSYDEARRLRNGYVGTEHLLLGLIREERGLAGRVLTSLGVDLDRAREEVRALQYNDSGVDTPEGPASKSAPTSLVDYLFDRGYASAEQVENAKAAPQSSIHDLIKVLIEAGLNPIHVYEARAHELGQPFIDVTVYNPDPDALRTVPVDVAKRLNVLPVKIDGKILYVAMGDTNDIAAADELRLVSQCTVRGVHAVPAHITDAILRNYSNRMPRSPLPTGSEDALRVLIQADTTKWRGRFLVSLFDVSAEQISEVLDVAARMKALKRQDKHVYFAHPKTLALLFEKPSLRTRVSFESGMAQMAGHAIYLAPADVGLGVRESVADVAGGLSRWLDVIAARTFKHETVEELAANATIPVINALSDREHPIQAFADLLTIQELKGKLGNHLKVAYVGDGFNVLHALLLACAKVGVNLTAACPKGHKPAREYVLEAQRIGAGNGGTGARIEIVTDPLEAVKDADVVYTDVWTNMGQETETAQRRQIFTSYQVTAAMLAHAKSDVIVLHCLPAHRDEEITTEVMDAYKTIILDQAENRLHTQKALVALMLGL
ncbi:MAG: ornithine carbamoyltransferase [Chthonomonadaceae bacterium]|nr:ornithine carbamoyltransferase [Chthonomonadaceae bacterium]